MNRFLFVLAVCVSLLVLPTSANGQFKRMLYLDGPPIETLPEYITGEKDEVPGVLQSRYGVYIKVAELSAPTDTLWMYLQHVTLKGQPPRTPESNIPGWVDYVVWCHPQEYPHEKHLLPNVEGEVVSFGQNGVIVFTGRSYHVTKAEK